MHRLVKALAITALAAVTMPSKAVDSDLYLAGLGLHQDTGRNIYLGGIYLERETPRPAKLTEAKGSRTMEYRVVARRTSIRSLLGGMLLQSEVATGNPPDQATTEFSDAILTAVNTSLYAGDSLEVRLAQNNETIALLNGYELARISNSSVADYFLMGWVGDSGPSTSFRKGITSPEVDPELLTALENNTYTKQREAEIASWLEPESAENPEDSAAEVDADIANGDGIKETIASSEISGSDEVSSEISGSAASDSDEEIAVAVADTVANGADKTTAEVAIETTPDTVAKTAVQHPATDEALVFVQPTSVALESVLPSTAASSSNEVLGTDEKTPTNEENSASTEQSALANTGAVQVASLVPMVEMLPTSSLEKEIQSMGIQEYSQRLSQFHSALVRMVYSKIRYPKRAVRRGIQGRMELDVTMDSQGDILNISVAVPSGFELLDEAAIDAANNALSRGFPSAVDPVAIAEFGDFATEQLTVPVPVSFKLE